MTVLAHICFNIFIYPFTILNIFGNYPELNL